MVAPARPQSPQEAKKSLGAAVSSRRRNHMGRVVRNDSGSASQRRGVVARRLSRPKESLAGGSFFLPTYDCIPTSCLSGPARCLGAPRECAPPLDQRRTMNGAAYLIAHPQFCTAETRGPAGAIISPQRDGRKFKPSCDDDDGGDGDGACDACLPWQNWWGSATTRQQP